MKPEEKAMAYDEALKRARKYKKYNYMMINAALDNIFPEIKESEDEKIRKELIDYHRSMAAAADDYVHEVCIDWLEKQGEQKPVTIDIDKMVSDYANNKERGNEEFGKPVNCMIRAYRQGLTDAMGKVVLRPAWSEEDRNLLKTTIDSLNAYAEKVHPCLKSVVKDEIDWLKSIKARYTWKPSDEQMKRLSDILKLYDGNYGRP